MRPLVYVLSAFFILFAAACGKDGVKGNVSLTGKWKLSQNLADPGDGSGTWQPVTNSTSLMLNSDGTTSGTTFPNYVKYTTQGDTELTFSQVDKTTQNYRFKISHDTLFMSPDGPIRCFEACGIKFVKVN